LDGGRREFCHFKNFSKIFAVLPIRVT